jgi:hypothetical protein
VVASIFSEATANGFFWFTEMTEAPPFTRAAIKMIRPSWGLSDLILM